MDYSVQFYVANVIRLAFLAYILSIMAACTVTGTGNVSMTQDPLQVPGSISP
jgi:hypothetical protein